MSSRPPWKDRTELLKDISSFIIRNGGFFNQNSKRMSDLFEMSVYNDVVKYYRKKRYQIDVCNLKKDGTFKYKLSPSGLASNFSFFTAKKISRGVLLDSLEIHHNIKLQSAFDNHIYYTADVSVTVCDGITTENQKSNRRHSFIRSTDLVTFLEVKNTNPFPEILISFSGIVLEIKPQFINGSSLVISDQCLHLTPSIVFSGVGSAYAETVADKLSNRYGYNVIRGLFRRKGKIYSFDKLKKYNF